MVLYFKTTGIFFKCFQIAGSPGDCLVMRYALSENQLKDYKPGIETYKRDCNYKNKKNGPYILLMTVRTDVINVKSRGCAVPVFPN